MLDFLICGLSCILHDYVKGILSLKRKCVEAHDNTSAKPKVIFLENCVYEISNDRFYSEILIWDVKVNCVAQLVKKLQSYKEG